MSRFALIVTRNRALSKWQVHRAQCPDVLQMVSRGAFAQILSSKSAECLRQTELEIPANYNRTYNDCVIMPCCHVPCTAPNADAVAAFSGVFLKTRSS